MITIFAVIKQNGKETEIKENPKNLVSALERMGEIEYNSEHEVIDRKVIYNGKTIYDGKE